MVGVIKGFRLSNPSPSRVITSRDVTFNEYVFLHVESSKKVAKKGVENKTGEETQEEAEDDILDDYVDTETPKESGDVPFTPPLGSHYSYEENIAYGATTSIAQRRPRRQV